MSVLTISVQRCSRVLARTVKLEKAKKKKKGEKMKETKEKEGKKNYFYSQMI